MNGIYRAVAANWKTALAGGLFALALAVAVWIPVLASGNPVMLWGRRDLWNYFGPAAFYFDHSLHQGVWPWWNPHVFCGTPFAANPQSSVFYPPHLIRGLLNFAPTPHRSMVSILLMQWVHLTFAGAGMALLCRSHRLSKTASAVAIICFTLCGQIAFRSVQHWHFIACAAWVPWAILGMRGALRADTRRPLISRLLCLGMMTGMVLLIGFPQLAIYFLVCCAGFGFFYQARVCLQSGHVFRKLGRLCLVLVCMVVIGAVLALPMLVPAAEFAGHTLRVKAVGDFNAVISHRPRPYLEYPESILRALIWFPGANSLQLAGITALMLAFVAFFRQGRTVLPYAGLLIIMLDCALGPPWPCATIVSWLAPFGIAETERAALFLCFALSMLAAFGMDALIRTGNNFHRPGLLTALVAVLGIACIGVLWEWEVLAPEYPANYRVWGIQFLGMLCVLMLLIRRKVPFMAKLVPFFVAVELVLWSQALVGGAITGDMYPGRLEEVFAKPSHSLSNQRMTTETNRENGGMLSLSPAFSGYDPLVLASARNFLCPTREESRYNRNVRSTDVLRENPRGNTLLKRRFWLSKKTLSCPVPEKERFFPICAYVPLGGNAPMPDNTSITPGMEAFASLDVSIVVQVTENGETFLALPAFDAPRHHAALRLWIEADMPGKMRTDFVHAESGQEHPALDVVWDTGETLVEIPLPDLSIGLVQPRFWLAGNTTAPQILRGELVEDLGDEGNLIQIVEAGPNGVTLCLKNLPGERWLVFTESDYPGWTAKVNGIPTQITRAYGVFQAVPVPSCDATVQFVFCPARNMLAVWVGLLAWLGCLCLLGILRSIP